MKNNLFAIAKITKATGLKGEVNIRPLIRQFNEYVDNDLYVGFDKNLTNDVKISNVSGSEKKTVSYTHLTLPTTHCVFVGGGGGS